jgi:Predicted membrane protein
MSLIACPKCGKQISEQSDQCIHCGYQLTRGNAANPPMPAPGYAPNYPTPSGGPARATADFDGAKKIVDIVAAVGGIVAHIGGIVSGFVAIHFSNVVQNMSIGYYESDSSYGGDAYTGIQNAAAQTANNVKALSEIVRKGLSGLLLALGIALIFFFAAGLLRQIQKSTGLLKPSAQGAKPNAVNANSSPVNNYLPRQ